jgi:hypothetical protein
VLQKQPIAGYELKERIGAGGYGEVWRADAPGGLVKAIKFIYGQLDEVRATAELKSLQRIKQVRHPFLLSLERIEVIDGQLVIVTELADGCLKDRYTECRNAEQPGIPRDELLVYMGDAADALDYMNANFSLQHLDVKPENLLLVGGRVKVGDFGLVKDIHDYTVSLMGGLTPVYAPPEVFDGKPSHFSDQYSLAIVYQEMLTGTLPFPGKTAAQLAAQHLHGQPRLSCLPQGDRGTIQRALSKTPTERFPTCRAMVDELLEAGRAKRSSQPSPPPAAAGQSAAPGQTAPLSPEGRDAATEQVGAAQVEAAPAAAHVDTHTLIQPVVLRSRADAVVTDRPPVSCTPEEVRLRPTLLVGIGGQAATLLRGVRRCLHERFGRLDAVPAIGMLLLDTDRAALYQATQGEEAGALLPSETLALPLRRTQDYRRDSDKFLKWLSRRWLYNIPRSLETEGLRPLGRLAFVDHLDDVRKRLTEATKHITAKSAIEATQAATGIDFADGPPRVVLVASICGGTGSGIVLDAAYLVRSLERELGFATAEVSGILLHATPTSAQARELATVNAYACLSELHHFSQATHGYPGDPACRLAATSLPPLDQAYLVHLGDDLDDERLTQGIGGVAAYLYHDLATPAGPLLAKCRATREPATDAAEIQVRTLGVCRVGGAGSPLADTAVELLARTVVERWSGEASQPGVLVKESPVGSSRSRRSDVREANDFSRLSLECADALELELPRLRGRMDQLVEAALGKPPAAHLGALAQQFVAQQAALHGKNGPLAVEDFVETLDRLLGPRCDEAQLPAPTVALEKALVKQIEALAESRGATLVNWLYQTAALPQAGAQGAQKAAEWFVQHLRALEREAREAMQTLRQEIASCEQILVGAPVSESPTALLGLGRGKKAAPARDEVLLQMALRRAADLSLRSVVRLVRGMAQRVGAALDALRDLRRTLGDLTRGFEPGPPLEDDASDGLSAAPIAIGKAVQSRLDELADQLVAGLSRDVLGERGLRLLVEQPELIAQLPGQLRQAARQTVRTAMGQFDLAGWLLEESEGRLKEALAKAQPRLLTECGGGRRYLICHPQVAASEAAEDSGDERLPDALCEQFHVEPMLAFGTDPDLVICCEAENVSLARAAANLAEESVDLPQTAARVRTRIDISWGPLPQ